MAFWQGVLVLGALGAVFVLWPIFRLPISRGLAAKTIRRDVTQADLYQEHLADLDKNLANGDIEQEQYEALKIELQRTLVSDSAGLKEVEVKGGGKLLLVGVAITAPLLAVFLYLQWGAKGDWDIHQIMQAERDNPATTQEAYEASTKELLMAVRSRLKQKPDNHQMRYLLAERSMALKDYDEAIAAYKILLEVEPDSPTMSIKLAQALFVRGGSKVTPEVAHHTDVAVNGAPFMYQALEMSGLVAFHNKEYKNAVTFWQRAKSQLDPNSRSAQALDGAIMKAARAGVASDQAMSGNDSAEATAKNKEEPKADRGFDLDVKLAEGLKASPGDTVFVYARAWKGAKMPLAIARMTVADLPKVVRLDTTMAMAPGMDMSTATELELIARISKSGSPVPQSGDWQGSLGPVVLGQAIEAKSIVIADKIP